MEYFPNTESIEATYENNNVVVREAPKPTKGSTETPVMEPHSRKLPSSFGDLRCNYSSAPCRETPAMSIEGICMRVANGRTFEGRCGSDEEEMRVDGS